MRRRRAEGMGTGWVCTIGVRSKVRKDVAPDEYKALVMALPGHRQKAFLLASKELLGE